MENTERFKICKTGIHVFNLLLSLFCIGCSQRAVFDVEMHSGKNEVSIPSLDENDFHVGRKTMKEDGHCLFENNIDSVVIFVSEIQGEDEISKALKEENYFPNVFESYSMFEIGLKFVRTQDLVEIEKLKFIKHNGKGNYPKGYVLIYNYSNITVYRRVDIEILRILGDFDLTEALEWGNKFSGITIKEE